MSFNTFQESKYNVPTMYVCFHTKYPPFIIFVYCDYTFKVVYYIMYSTLATKMTLAVFTKLQFLPDENIQDVAQISYVNKKR